MTPPQYTRRRFLSAALGVAGLSFLRSPIAAACPLLHKLPDNCDKTGWLDGGRLALEGYLMRRSYMAGDRVQLCLSSASRSRATVTIHRLGAEAESVWTAPVWVKPIAIPSDASERGCGWDHEEDSGIAFELPSAWSTGFYRVTISTPSHTDRKRLGQAFFVIRSSTPGNRSKILLVLATNTYFAYNNYGWRHPSKGTSTKGGFYTQSPHASFLRPLPLGFISPYECATNEESSLFHRFAGWDKWEEPFVMWAERNGIALEYATNEDLERYPDLLKSYRLILSVGHDEYWSEGMRNALEQYIMSGGNVAFFSGNVCYRKVHLDLIASRMNLIGDMDGDALWSHRQGPNRPENQLTGVSFCHGALNPQPVPYTIYQPNHWVFDGLWPSGGIRKSFPQVGCIGFECDGCDVEWVRGIPVASHRDGTPKGFEVLGFAPGRMPDYEATVHSKALYGLEHGFTPWGRDLRDGGAVLGLWTNGGTVFTVGCTEWARHLADPIVAQITRNVIRRLAE